MTSATAILKSWVPALTLIRSCPRPPVYICRSCGKSDIAHAHPAYISSTQPCAHRRQPCTLVQVLHTADLFAPFAKTQCLRNLRKKRKKAALAFMQARKTHSCLSVAGTKSE